MYSLFIDTIDGDKLLKNFGSSEEIESIVRDQCVGSILILLDLTTNTRSIVTNDISSIWKGKDILHMRKVKHI